MSSNVDEIFSALIGIIILVVFISSILPAVISVSPTTEFDWSLTFLMLIVVLALAIISVFAAIGREIGDWFS